MTLKELKFVGNITAIYRAELGPNRPISHRPTGLSKGCSLASHFDPSPSGLVFHKQLGGLFKLAIQLRAVLLVIVSKVDVESEDSGEVTICDMR